MSENQGLLNLDQLKRLAREDEIAAFFSEDAAE